VYSDPFAVIHKRGSARQRIKFSDLLYSNREFFEFINLGFAIKQCDLTNRIFEPSGNEEFEFQTDYLEPNVHNSQQR